MKKTFITLAILIIVVLVIAFVGKKYITAPTTQEPPQVEPTSPIPDDTADWKTEDNKKFSFKYPETIGTTYISTQEWPPNVTLEDKSYSCVASQGEGDVAAQITEKTINGRTYCISTVSEGAAGSTYMTSTYTTALNDQLVAIEFTLRMVQCLNYDDPQQSECAIERSSFNPDDLVDRITQTVVVK